MKEIFDDNTMHVEIARGTYEDNYSYCTKEGEFFEFGQPKTGGKNI